MAFDLRVYENQATLSMVLGVVGGVCAAAGGLLVFAAFDPGNFVVVYGMWGRRFLAVCAALGLGLAASAVGFFLALHSAGQRRNKRSDLSWKAFFLNAAVLTLSVALVLFFWLAGFAVSLG